MFLVCNVNELQMIVYSSSTDLTVLRMKTGIVFLLNLIVYLIFCKVWFMVFCLFRRTNNLFSGDLQHNPTFWNIHPSEYSQY